MNKLGTKEGPCEREGEGVKEKESWEGSRRCSKIYKDALREERCRRRGREEAGDAEGTSRKGMKVEESKKERK